jgi:hypothetical protein
MPPHDFDHYRIKIITAFAHGLDGKLTGKLQ